MIENEVIKKFSDSNSEKKSIYLLLRLGYPEKEFDRTMEHINSYKKTEALLGITIEKVIVENLNRYAFYFRNFLQNDEKANHIGEVIQYSANFVFGPVGNDFNGVTVFPIPRFLYKRNHKINLQELIDLEYDKFPCERHIIDPSFSIGSVMYISDSEMASAWRLVPILYKNDHIFQAMRYLKISEDNFYVYPGQYEDVINDSESSFTSGWEQGQMEISLLNSFKVIEALIGDIPHNDGKIKHKLSEIGLNPCEGFGLDCNIPLYKFLKLMNKERDQISAHGNKSSKKILVRDMWLFQGCARYVLRKIVDITNKETNS